MLFVIEAGLKVGLGHLLRCRALLQELTARGHTADLWMHGDKSALAGREWPVEMRLFGSDDSESIDVACDGIGRVLERSPYEWLVIDGYGFAGRALCARLSNYGAKLLMLDDIADRELKSDILLNQNTTRMEIYADGRVDAARFLLGPQYALIDRSYAVRRILRRTHGELRKLLVTFGGVDRYDRTRRVIELVSRYASPLEIVAVAGPYYPYLDQLESMHGRHGLRILRNVRDLASLMQECDLMVTAGGTTVWQACCAGAPMLVLQTAENQKLIIRTLREFEAALCFDVSARPLEDSGISEHEFADFFRRSADAATRSKLAANAKWLVDGNGASRVADAVESGKQRSCQAI